ncbi:MAG TPA: metal-sulfur cluster assembly factor, partial [Candidatus Limnocylindrales bacterium]|nr:metal-sulfur cluster assembly factor [Candidatus Limnocylindrales bacterium]
TRRSRMATDEEIRAALEQVVDPEISLSIIELGLVREIDQSIEPTVVRMLLTTPFCPYAPQIIQQVKEAVTTVTGKPSEVEILAEQWTPEMMPDPGLLGRW